MDTIVRYGVALLALLTVALNCKLIWDAWSLRNFKSVVALAIALPLAVWLAWWESHQMF